MVAFQSYKA